MISPPDPARASSQAPVQSPDSVSQQLAHWHVASAAQRVGIDTTHNDLRWPIFDPRTGERFHRKQRRTLDKQIRWTGPSDGRSTPWFSALPEAGSVARQFGTLHLAKGIKEYLALLTVGYDNVLLLTREQLSAAPCAVLVELCQDWSISRVIYAPDRDDAGLHRSAVPLRDAFDQTDISLDLRQLPFPHQHHSGQDLFDLYQHDPVTFQASYEQLPTLSLPAQTSPAPRRRVTSSPYPYLHSSQRDRWIETVVKPQLGPVDRHNRCRCPNPAHDDRTPSFRISYDVDDQGIGQCSCQTGISWDTLADWLSVTCFRNWCQQNASAPRVNTNTTREETPAHLSLNQPLHQQVASADKYVVHEPYLSGLPDGDIAVVSATGTGKTTQVQRACLGVERCLCLAHLRSLASSTASALGLTNYDDIFPRTACADVPQLVITTNSVHYLRQVGQPIPTFDLLVLEEFDQVLKYLVTSETFKTHARRTQALSILVDLIKNAKRVIVLSATLEQITWDFLRKFRPTMKLLYNTFLPDRGLLRYHDNLGEILQIIEAECLEEPAFGPPKRIYVASDSRGLLEDIETQVRQANPQLEVLLVTGRTNQLREVRRFLESPTQNAQAYRLILASPAVISGININPSEPFASVYGLFVNFYNDGRDLYQMLDRVRQRRCTHLYIRPSIPQTEPEAPAAIRQRLVNAWIRTGHLANFEQNGVTPIIPPTETMLLDLYTAIVAAQRESRAALKTHLHQLIAPQYSCIETTDMPAVDVRKRYLETATQRRESYQGLLTQIPRLSPEAYQEVRQFGHYHPEQTAAGRERDELSRWLGRDFGPPALECGLDRKDRRLAFDRRIMWENPTLDLARLCDWHERHSLRQGKAIYEQRHWKQALLVMTEIHQQLWGDVGLNQFLCETDFQERTEDVLQRLSAPIRTLIGYRPTDKASCRAPIKAIYHHFGYSLLSEVRKIRQTDGRRTNKTYYCIDEAYLQQTRPLIETRQQVLCHSYSALRF